jgi:hypothetical protein
LRHGNGRFAPAPFRLSLRLHYTFQFAEPQAEAKFEQRYSHYLSLCRFYT